MSDNHAHARAREQAIEALTQRFLGWEFPADLTPDGGLSYLRPAPPHTPPVGTNLMSHDQAKAMFVQLLDGFAILAPGGDDLGDLELPEIPEGQPIPYVEGIIPIRRGQPEPSNVREISDPDALASLAADAAEALALPMVKNKDQAVRLAEVIGRRVIKTSGDYEFDGEIRAIIPKRSGAIRYAVEDERGLLLVMNAKQCGLDQNARLAEHIVPSSIAPIFKITTGDPRFDPHDAVSINGFVYQPATKEK